MSKLRSVSTAFWSDPFIEELTPNEKLLFLYFITNEKTNMLGIYEVSIKKISFDTGINKDVIEKALKGFESLQKVKYVNNHVVLVNFMKHQNYNPNMKKSAIDIYNDLPIELKGSNLDIDKTDVSKGFETLSKALGTVPKVEVEYEYETKVEEETEEENISLPLENDFSKFWNIYNKKNDSKRCKDKFIKLPQKDIDKILEVVQFYANSTPDPQFRKNPLTWLNGKCWEDVVIDKTITADRPYGKTNQI